MGLFLLLSPLAGGGILAGFAVPVGLLALPIWALSLWAARQRSDAYLLSPVALFLLVLAALTLLRATSFGGWMATSLTAAGWPLWPTLPHTGALAPGGAASGAVRLIALALICDAASMRFGTTTGFKQLLAATSIAGVAAMLVGLLHDGVGSSALFGRYNFPAASHFIPLAAPFSNPNVAGSLACLAALAAWLLATLRTEGTAVRGVWAALGVSLLVHAARLEAHGALAATAAALGCGVIAWVIARRLRGGAATFALVMLPVASAAACAAVVSSLPGAASPVGAVPTLASKASFWRTAYSHVGEAGLFGFGPGSFHDLGARLLPMGGGYRPAFVESEPAQFIFDHGWLAACAATAVGCWLFFSTIRKFCAASQRGYAAALAVLAVWTLCDALLGMTWESLPVAMLVLALGTAAARTARPLPEGEGIRWRGWLIGSAAVVLLVSALPSLSDSMTLGQQRGRNPFAGTERKRSEVEGAWRDRVMAQARLSPVAPIVLVEEGRLALARGDARRAGEIASWLATAAPMDESSLAFRISEAESRQASDEVCARSLDYLRVNNAYLVRPRFWTRLGRNVTAWIACLPKESDAEQAAIGFLRREKRYEEALALTLGLMARSPRHLATLDAGYAIASSLRRYDSAEIFLTQRAAVSGEDARTVHMKLSLQAAQGEWRGMTEELSAAVARFPTDTSLRHLRLAAVRELALRGDAPEAGRTWVSDDGQSLRLASAGNPAEAARCALAVGQALLALGSFDEAEQHLKLARDEAAFRAAAERWLSKLQQIRRQSGKGVERPYPTTRP